MMVEINNISEVLDYIDNIRVVIFDMDDTLYNERDYVKSGYTAVAEQVLYKYNGVTDMLWNEFIIGSSAIDAVLYKLGIFSEKLKQECLVAYREHYPNIKLSKEVQDVLEEVGRRKKYLGIITDGRSEGQRLKIKALKLEKYVDNIIITDELGGISYRKPCDKAFWQMKDIFKVEFNEMCYIGDNINKDFIAPKKLGMRQIWFQNKAGLYYIPK